MFLFLRYKNRKYKNIENHTVNWGLIEFLILDFESHSISHTPWFQLSVYIESCSNVKSYIPFAAERMFGCISKFMWHLENTKFGLF